MDGDAGGGPYIQFDLADGTDPDYTIYNTGMPYNIIGSSTAKLPLVYVCVEWCIYL